MWARGWRTPVAGVLLRLAFSYLYGSGGHIDKLGGLLKRGVLDRDRAGLPIEILTFLLMCTGRVFFNLEVILFINPLLDASASLGP